MRFKKDRRPYVFHSQYGDGRLVQTYKQNKVCWYEVIINDHLIVHTPRSEWTWKDFSK